MKGASGTVHGRAEQVRDVSSAPGGLLDVLGVAAVVLDTEGRVVLWSPQAEALFGYTAEEALGQYAGRLLLEERHLEQVLELFARLMETGESWAGGFPIRCKDGSTRMVEFRNMRLENGRGGFYALGIASDQATLREVERRLALSVRLIEQSPIGLAVLDTDLRFVTVNPALERINGVPAADHIGRRLPEVVPLLGPEVEAVTHRVLRTGVPLLDQLVIGRTPADPDHDHAWSVSRYRLEDPNGRVLGVAASVVDVTERHRAEIEASRARRRLTMIADATLRVGTTLDLERTARELAGVCVPDLADVATVDVLDSVLQGHHGTEKHQGPALFRSLAVAAARPTEAVRAADPPGELAVYDTDRLAAQCVNLCRPVRVPHVNRHDLRHIARSAEAAELLARAGLHSYLAVPLTARGEILGVLGLQRIHNTEPFSQDDTVLAGELAARAALSIDNARWYRSQRHAALALQRHLLPQHPQHLTGLEVAGRYQPAAAVAEVGGDWFDAIPLAGDKTALVVGDVMGSGINAAATMGQLRTATRAFADLDLAPAEVLERLDHTSTRLEEAIITCAYAVYDPHRAQCHVSLAGHLPPALVHPGRAPRLLDLPTSTPLGVGGIPFRTTTFELDPGDLLVLYTDGLVESRNEPIDRRLETFLGLLDDPKRPLEETCDRLLHTLRRPDDHDDVALLVARARPLSDG
ncbi:magnesium or manganese-dependent protein phosphatase [Streptomyces sp. F-3]|uniref:SpoIIE family protein phosphatase n=1 Tax=unclassified Streptomyces TaxID=2593676 RepID=UPI0007C30186|nr:MULTISPECIES: SpoIIE family protein phosphatase [unclassified Streptomyces]MDN5382091.1 SpoIIE family protein phosphatase [Streptomyces sp. LB8]GAT79699.1 magnesium or manganese-dependent protein phosphatase [Streptomyces sp. F-3]